MSLEKNKDVIRRHYEELFNGRRLESGELSPDEFDAISKWVRYTLVRRQDKRPDHYFE